MGMNVNWAEDLLSFIGIRPDLATYPMADYLPEGVSLSDENFAQALRAAAAAAQEAGGGIVQIPAGTWHTGTSEFEFASAGRNAPLYIEGAGLSCTTLLVDVGYEGTLIHLTGLPSDGATDLYYDGGLANFTIAVEEEDVLTTGTGIKISSCIGTQFLNVTVRNLSGGNGFHSTFTAPDFTNQYIQLWNFTSSSNDVNYRLTSFVNSQGYSVFSASAVTREYLCDDVKAAFYGGNMQSSAPICFELAGNGGCLISLHDFYYEGFAGTIFKLNQPAVTSNQMAVYNFQCGGAPTIFADTNVFNDLTLTSINGVTNSGTVLKARNGAITILTGCSDSVALPGKFDLDAASAAQTIYISNGCVTAAQTKFVPRAATGVTGPALFVDSTGGALKFKGAGGTVTTLAPT